MQQDNQACAKFMANRADGVQAVITVSVRKESILHVLVLVFTNE